MVMKGNENHDCHDKFPLNLIFFAGSIALLVVALVIDMYTLLIIFAVLYVASLIEACCSKTSKYLSNIESVRDTYSLVERLKHTAPIIRFHIQCYHYEIRR